MNTRNDSDSNSGFSTSTFVGTYVDRPEIIEKIIIFYTDYFNSHYT